MTVLVTGGSGLVGSHVIAELRAAGIPVRALVREPARGVVQALGAEAVVGDVTDPRAWARAGEGVDAIVHAAALVAQPVAFERFVDVNVGGTRLAVETAQARGAHLVHISSVAVYGRGAAAGAGHPVDEEFPFQPLAEPDFYARTKRMAEAVVRDAAARGGPGATAIRPNVIYGERDRLFTPRVIRVAAWGILPLVGDGRNHLSCVYAGNVASAVAAAVRAPASGFRAYNVTRDAPPELTQREFFAAFAAELGTRVRWVPLPRALAVMAADLWAAWRRLRDPGGYAGLGRAAVWFLTGDNPYSADRITRELGWRPPVDTRTAIQRAVRWYRGARRSPNEMPGKLPGHR